MRIIHLAPADESARPARQAAIDTAQLESMLDVQLWRYQGAEVVDGSGRSGRLRRLLRNSGAALVHVYGHPDDPRLLAGLSLPWVGETPVSGGRLPWNRIPKPVALLDDPSRYPESVSVDYLSLNPSATPEWMVASVGGAGRSELRERTLARIGRFRDDVSWTEFDEIPQASDLAQVRLWVDGGTAADGGALEALAAGLAVVAARTGPNIARSNGGESAWLVPVDDPNELAHAILTTLFKPERMAERLAAARTGRQRFHPERRAASLVALYRRVIQ